MEKKLTITKLTETLVRITCEGGKVLDIRTNKSYSEVECDTTDIKYFKAL